MTAAVRAEYNAHARMIEALAHPTRLFIVDELSRGEGCMFELAEMIGIEMPTMSRHPGLLSKAGILEDEQRGAEVFHRLRTQCALNIFKRIEAFQDIRGFSQVTVTNQA